MLIDNRNDKVVSEDALDRSNEQNNGGRLALVLDSSSTDQRTDNVAKAETASHVNRLQASLNTLGVELVEVALEKADGLSRAAEVEAQQIRADAEGRAVRVLNDAERARAQLLDTARQALLGVERFLEALLPVDESRSTVTTTRELPPIHWHPAADTKTPISPSISPSRSDFDQQALLAPIHQPAPGDGVWEVAAAHEDVVAPDVVANTAAAPQREDVATTPVRRHRYVLRFLGVIAVTCVSLASFLVLPALFGTSGDGQPRPVRTPSTTPAVPLASIDATRFMEHWSKDFAALAPAGLVVSDAGVAEPAPEAATNEFDGLATALATDRVGGSAGTFVRKGTSAQSASASGSESRAAASVSSYASLPAAAAAYDAAHGYYISDRNTGAGDTPIKLAPNIALRSFGYRRTVQGTRTLFAYLEFPGALVQLSTSGSSDELNGMIAVVEGWATG